MIRREEFNGLADILVDADVSDLVWVCSKSDKVVIKEEIEWCLKSRRELVELNGLFACRVGLLVKSINKF